MPNYGDIKVTTQEEEIIKEKSPMRMPLNPTAQGWSSQEIRKKLASAILDNDGSVLALIKDKFEKTSDLFDYVFSEGSERVEISEGEEPLNSDTKLWVKKI